MAKKAFPPPPVWKNLTGSIRDMKPGDYLSFSEPRKTIQSIVCRVRREKPKRDYRTKVTASRGTDVWRLA